MAQMNTIATSRRLFSCSIIVLPEPELTRCQVSRREWWTAADMARDLLLVARQSTNPFCIFWFSPLVEVETMSFFPADTVLPSQLKLRIRSSARFEGVLTVTESVVVAEVTDLAIV
jgi:hypothetical protein